MKKITYNGLGLEINSNTNDIIFNDKKINVKQYLPVAEKLLLIADVIAQTEDDNVFYNPCKIKIFESILIFKNYVNIEVEEENYQDLLKMYDELVSSGLLEKIYNIIPQSEIDYIHAGIKATIDQIYSYKNSAVGMIQQINDNYEDLEEKAKNINEELSNKDNLKMINDVITKLG